MNIVFILDPLDSLKIHKDSSFALMHAAQARGHAVFALLREDVVLAGGEVVGQVRRIELVEGGGSGIALGRLNFGLWRVLMRC